MSCEYKEKVLNLLKNDIEDKELEAHIESCDECSALVEGYLESEKDLLPYIPSKIYSGSDQKLKLKVTKYSRGRSRIIVFTIIGMILGWLSFRYTQDSFIVTKILMAIPYKISEMIYTTLHHAPYIYTNTVIGGMNEYFPQSMLITFLAERITPVFIGGAVYGSIGYFTGDKRIFTLSKYLTFAVKWGVVILLWIGVVFAGNAISIKENSQLKDINGFFIMAEDHGNGFHAADQNDAFTMLRDALGDVSLLTDIKNYKVTGSQTTVGIYMGLGRYNLTIVNWDEKYMIMDTGRVVSIPDAFAQLIKDYYVGTGSFANHDYKVKKELNSTGEVKEDEADKAANKE